MTAISDREPCHWAYDCDEPAVAEITTAGFNVTLVCETHLGVAIEMDPDREVWHTHDNDEQGQSGGAAITG